MDLKSFIPKEPGTIFELNISDEVVSNLILKELYVRGKRTARQVGKTLKVKPDIVQTMLNELKQQELVGLVGGSGMGADYQYGLYPKGIEQAKNIYARDTYLGPAPVSFEEYTRVTREVLKVNKAETKINQATMEAKLQGHTGYKDVLMQMGQALCARKPAFVFGFPGNGKTFLCSQVANLMPPTLVPYAVDVGNQLVRIFDPSCHQVVETIDTDTLDQRWIPVKPPMIMVGGELTLEDLEVVYNKKFGCYDAPPQVKANGGVLLIDDLGRQRCGVEEIFNRFIVPLENKIDFLVLGGQRMQVLTDEIILFSTNLDPMKIVDDAFLRRLPYKINVRNPTLEEYTSIWKINAEKLGLKFDPANISELMGIYRERKRGLRAVHPRDLLQIIRDRKRFQENTETTISSQELKEAYEIYFVTQLTLVETIT